MNRFLNPFRYLAGTKALAWGLLFILLTAGVLRAASMVQDSLLHFAFVRDLSFGRRNPSLRNCKGRLWDEFGSCTLLLHTLERGYTQLL